MRFENKIAMLQLLLSAVIFKFELSDTWSQLSRVTQPNNKQQEGRDLRFWLQIDRFERKLTLLFASEHFWTYLNPYLKLRWTILNATKHIRAFFVIL